MRFCMTQGRVEYTSVTDDEALAAFETLSKLEGIIPALRISACRCPRSESRRRHDSEDEFLIVNFPDEATKTSTPFARALPSR